MKPARATSVAGKNVMRRLNEGVPMVLRESGAAGVTAWLKVHEAQLRQGATAWSAKGGSPAGGGAYGRTQMLER
jgi:hypothetical protein